MKELIENLDPRKVAEGIAPYGKVDRGVRSSRPKNENGLVQYVWRMVRFHTGEDNHMPVTCQFWLTEYLEEEGIIPERIRGLDFDDPARRENLRERKDTQREIEKALDPFIDEVIEEFGMDPNAAAKRWKRAGLF